MDNSIKSTHPRLVEAIVQDLKSGGKFDQFRKECLADVDTKPAYQNLQSRVESQVKKFLNDKVWTRDSNKNQLRDGVRKQVQESGMLGTGIDSIINQVVNPIIQTMILPCIEESVRTCPEYNQFLDSSSSFDQVISDPTTKSSNKEVGDMKGSHLSQPPWMPGHDYPPHIPQQHLPSQLPPQFPLPYPDQFPPYIAPSMHYPPPQPDELQSHYPVPPPSAPLPLPPLVHNPAVPPPPVPLQEPPPPLPPPQLLPPLPDCPEHEPSSPLSQTTSAHYNRSPSPASDRSVERYSRSRYSPSDHSDEKHRVVNYGRSHSPEPRSRRHEHHRKSRHERRKKRAEARRSSSSSPENTRQSSHRKVASGSKNDQRSSESRYIRRYPEKSHYKSSSDSEYDKHDQARMRHGRGERHELEVIQHDRQTNERSRPHHVPDLDDGSRQREDRPRYQYPTDNDRTRPIHESHHRYFHDLEDSTRLHHLPDADECCRPRHQKDLDDRGRLRHQADFEDRGRLRYHIDVEDREWARQGDVEDRCWPRHSVDDEERNLRHMGECVRPGTSGSTLPLGTDVISSEEDEIIAAKSSSSRESLQEQTSADATVSSAPRPCSVASDVVEAASEVQRLSLRDESISSSMPQLYKNVEAAANTLFDAQSLDSISSNSSGLSFAAASNAAVTSNSSLNSLTDSKIAKEEDTQRSRHESGHPEGEIAMETDPDDRLLSGASPISAEGSLDCSDREEKSDQRPLSVESSVEEGELRTDSPVSEGPAYEQEARPSVCDQKNASPSDSNKKTETSSTSDDHFQFKTRLFDKSSDDDDDQNGNKETSTAANFTVSKEVSAETQSSRTNDTNGTQKGASEESGQQKTATDGRGSSSLSKQQLSEKRKAEAAAVLARRREELKARNLHVVARPHHIPYVKPSKSSNNLDKSKSCKSVANDKKTVVDKAIKNGSLVPSSNAFENALLGFPVKKAKIDIRAKSELHSQKTISLDEKSRYKSDTRDTKDYKKLHEKSSKENRSDSSSKGPEKKPMLENVTGSVKNENPFCISYLHSSKKDSTKHSFSSESSKSSASFKHSSDKKEHISGLVAVQNESVKASVMNTETARHDSTNTKQAKKLSSEPLVPRKVKSDSYGHKKSVKADSRDIKVILEAVAGSKVKACREISKKDDCKISPKLHEKRSEKNSFVHSLEIKSGKKSVDKENLIAKSNNKTDTSISSHLVTDNRSLSHDRCDASAPPTLTAEQTNTVLNVSKKRKLFKSSELEANSRSDESYSSDLEEEFKSHKETIHETSGVTGSFLLVSEGLVGDHQATETYKTRKIEETPKRNTNVYRATKLKKSHEPSSSIMTSSSKLKFEINAEMDVKLEKESNKYIENSLIEESNTSLKSYCMVQCPQVSTTSVETEKPDSNSNSSDCCESDKAPCIVKKQSKIVAHRKKVKLPIIPKSKLSTILSTSLKHRKRKSDKLYSNRKVACANKFCKTGKKSQIFKNNIMLTYSDLFASGDENDDECSFEGFSDILSKPFKVALEQKMKNSLVVLEDMYDFVGFPAIKVPHETEKICQRYNKLLDILECSQNNEYTLTVTGNMFYKGLPVKVFLDAMNSIGARIEGFHAFLVKAPKNKTLPSEFTQIPQKTTDMLTFNEKDRDSDELDFQGFLQSEFHVKPKATKDLLSMTGRASNIVAFNPKRAFLKTYEAQSPLVLMKDSDEASHTVVQRTVKRRSSCDSDNANLPLKKRFLMNHVTDEENQDWSTQDSKDASGLSGDLACDIHSQFFKIPQPLEPKVLLVPFKSRHTRGSRAPPGSSSGAVTTNKHHQLAEQVQ